MTRTATGAAAAAAATAAEYATERALVARVRAGDTTAFDAIYTAYHDRIANYVARQIGPRGEPAPDDLTQDVFLKAWAALTPTAAREGEFRLGAWLYRIATNTCRDLQRHRTLAHFEPWDWFAALPGTHRYVQRQTLDLWHPGHPEREALDGELRAEVTRVLDDLGAAFPQYRRVLVLREYHDLSYDDCAAVLGLTRPALKSLLYRARAAFAALWTDPNPDGDGRAAPARSNAPSLAWLAAKLQAAHAAEAPR